jgi:hypothetical protein
MYDLDRWQARHWTKGTRVYAATVQQTLFGDWQVQRAWGGKGRRGGRTFTLPASSYAEALSLMHAIAAPDAAAPKSRNDGKSV